MGMPITYPQMYAYIYAVIDDLKNSAVHSGLDSTSQG